MKEYGFYNIFLICSAHGHVVFSEARDSAMGANVGCGNLKNEGLGKVWKKVVDTKSIAIEDFAPYSPSNGEMAAFIGAPVFYNEDLKAVVVLQIPTKPINAIMQEHEGMGKTGESYLLGRLNGKSSYRNDRVVKEGKIG